MTSEHSARTRRPAAEPVEKPVEVPGGRSNRRRRQTRERLLEAALSLFALHGVDGVSINEITEAADLGFGTFYNHFESKEALHAALLDTLFGRLARLFDLVLAQQTDIAAIVSHSIRYVILYAIDEPMWARLLIQTHANGQLLNQHFGQYLFRDIAKGRAGGRFFTDDPLVTFLAVGGTVLTAISAVLLGEAAFNEKLGNMAPEHLTIAQLDTRAARAALLLLGVPAEEAAEIAGAPLPPLVLPP